MQAIFGKNFKGGIKLRSYCKQHSPDVNVENGSSSQADKIDASGVKEIDMTNLVDDRPHDGSEELDYFWKYVDINEVHRNISDAYARAKRLSLAATSIDDSGDIDSKQKKNSNNKKQNNSSDDSQSPKKSNTPKKNKTKHIEDKKSHKRKSVAQIQEVDPLMIDLIYRYWMLLRTANNGQSLIKFSPTALKEREFEQRKSILKLRIELERVRNLSYMIGKREKLKASWLNTHQNIIKRTFSVINDLSPPVDSDSIGSDNICITQNNSHHVSAASTNGKKSLHITQHLQPTNGIFDESNQLINDLISCDHIYDMPNSPSNINSNHSNLSYQERSTLERRRTLSLVRRINRQLKSVSIEPSLNPYAKSYLVPKRSDSPVSLQQSTAAKMLKYR